MKIVRAYFSSHVKSDCKETKIIIFPWIDEYGFVCWSRETLNPQILSLFAFVLLSLSSRSWSIVFIGLRRKPLSLIPAWWNREPLPENRRQIKLFFKTAFHACVRVCECRHAFMYVSFVKRQKLIVLPWVG